MKEIISYRFIWNVANNEGSIHVGLADDSRDQILVDSPGEAQLLLDVLRNDRPVFYDAQHGLVLTGFERVGADEGAAG